jgi:histidinol dehydrogenase
MKVFRFPEKADWPTVLARPPVDSRQLEGSVREIIETVKTGGDSALRDFTQRFDGVALEELKVSTGEMAAAAGRLPDDLKNAIATAAANVEKFHAAQLDEPAAIETMPGVACWRKSVAIERVGLYVPAGSAPLFSTVLMLGISARLAGCGEIVLCSPPNSDGRIDDAVLYTASVCGITSIYKVGGAQAIAAMAYGTESVPKVYKIFGPGNSYVTAAKQIVAADVAIDMPAGPSEVAVLADDSSNPRFVAADLLSQAEHGPDSQVILVTTSEVVIKATLAEIDRQLADLPRADTAKRSLANSKAILVHTLEEGIDLLNEYAAEHLILAVENADEVAETVINAGSVFIGNYSCESAGDYASGTNHTLPTGGFAKSFSGVSVDSFVKKITFQKLSPEGIRNLGPAIELMAAAEGLDAHKRAISVRLEEVNNAV